MVPLLTSAARRQAQGPDILGAVRAFVLI